MLVPSLEALVPASGEDGGGSPDCSEDEAEPGTESKGSRRVKKIRRPLTRRVPRF